MSNIDRNKIFTIKEFREVVFEYFNSEGYEINEPASLISNSFKDTFNPSGAHDLVVKILSEPKELNNRIKKVGIDPCYRHIDLQISGNQWHSVFFEMLTYVDGYPINKLNIFQANKVLYDFLINFLKLDKEKFIITYFGGGNVKGEFKNKDIKAYNSWIKLGIREEQLIPIYNDKNYLYTESDGDGAGPRCELFYQYSDNKYVEVATAIYEIYRFNKGKLVETKNAVTGSGIGFERLYAIINGTFNIFQTEEYQTIREIIKKNIPNKILYNVFIDDINRLVSFLKALILLSSINNFKNKKNKVNRLIRESNRICKQLDISLNEVFTLSYNYIYKNNDRYFKNQQIDTNYEQIKDFINNIM